jgi:hypothetical protein
MATMMPITAPALIGRQFLHVVIGGLSSRRNPVGLRLVLRFGANLACLRSRRVGQFVGFSMRVNNWCFDFIAVLDMHVVIHLRLRRSVTSSHLRSLQLATEEYAEFEKVLLRTQEEVAGLAREHD